MAERRMMAKSIIKSDQFLEMPMSSQLLYFHLLSDADDDGFINAPKSIMRVIGAKEDDMRVLQAKGYTIPFDSGVIVIKHWRIHNSLRKDRYNPNPQLENERKQLIVNDKKEYELIQTWQPTGNHLATTWQPTGNRLATNGYHSIGKDSIGKDSIDEEDILSSKHDHASNEITEIIDYLNLKTNKNYKTTTQKTRTLIKARMNEHFTVDDFKIVINKMCTEWMGTNMEKYLRPETLFGTKFESYLNQTLTKSETEMRIDNVNALIDQYEREEMMSNGQGGYSESNSTIDCDVQKRY